MKLARVFDPIGAYTYHVFSYFQLVGLGHWSSASHEELTFEMCMFFFHQI